MTGGIKADNINFAAADAAGFREAGRGERGCAGCGREEKTKKDIKKVLTKKYGRDIIYELSQETARQRTLIIK